MNKPNSDYLETYYEIVAFITACEYIPDNDLISNMKKLIEAAQTNTGYGGLYQLAEELTDEFLKKYDNYLFDGDYFEKLEEFFNYIFTPEYYNSKVANN